MKKRMITALLIISTLLCSACGNGGGDVNAPAETTSAADTTTAETMTVGYKYPASIDYKGYKLRFLNSAAIWSMYINLDFEEMTGDVLDDTVYNRNRQVESKLNCVISVTEEEFEKVDDTAKASVLAGADDHDVMYIPDRYFAAMMTEGYFYNLLDIPELQLDEGWWDQPVISEATVAGKLFYATSDLNLMAFDGTWCLYFNKGMMKSLNLDEPYDLVDSGKWTLDALQTYMKKAASLNGDASFALTENSKATYGMSAFYNSVTKMLFGCGLKYVSKNDKGELVFLPQSERFYNAAEKIAKIISAGDGSYVNAATGSITAPTSYIYIFANNRALFMGGEVKAGLEMRASEIDFGIVPYPKYDEKQEAYHSNLVDRVLVMSIPMTNTDTARTGVIVDALSGESLYTTVPVYFDTHVSTKGLRDERSIDMLGIIRSSRAVDISVPFNWCSTLNTSIQNALLAGNGAVSSTIESNRTAVETSIKSTLEKFNALK